MFILILISICLLQSSFGYEGDFEAHSLIAPFGPNYWLLTGNASAVDDGVRLTERRQAQKGGLWNIFTNSYDHWEAEIRFTITGNANLGADGLAFWYTSEKETIGKLFGNTERFIGIGAIIDTYDNDGSGLHPYVMLVFNDGQKDFSHYHAPDDDDEEVQVEPHEHEGIGGPERNPLELGGCSFQVRNSKTDAIMKIRYDNKGVLSLFMSYDSTDETLCASGEVDVPPGGYFGFTAETGDLADEHKITSFKVKPINKQGLLVPEELPEQTLADVIYAVERKQSIFNNEMGILFERINDLNENMQQTVSWQRNFRRNSANEDSRATPPAAIADSLTQQSNTLSDVQGKIDDLKRQLHELRADVAQQNSLQKQTMNLVQTLANQPQAAPPSLGTPWWALLTVVSVNITLCFLLYGHFEQKAAQRRKMF